MVFLMKRKELPIGLFSIIRFHNNISFLDRAMFIIDDKGILRQITVNDRPVGRSIYEARRLIKTIQYADKMRESTSESGFVEGKKN